MINKFIYNITFLFCILLNVSCKNERQNNQHFNEGKYNITLLNDSVVVNEYIKGIAFIETPYFKDKNSRLIVYLENDEDEPLEKDLSNERDIPFDFFIDLEQDKYNQKWFEDYNFETSVALGKKFSTSGKKLLRGYFLEYYGGEYDPEKDTVFDSGEMKKQYFEIEVYIRDIEVISKDSSMAYKHKILKIDSLGNLYIIHSKKQDIYYKILSEKIINKDRTCNKVLVNKYYDLKLTSIFEGKIKPSYKTAGVLYKDQEIEFEKDSIYDLHIAENLNGLCI